MAHDSKMLYCGFKGIAGRTRCQGLRHRKHDPRTWHARHAHRCSGRIQRGVGSRIVALAARADEGSDRGEAAAEGQRRGSGAAAQQRHSSQLQDFETPSRQRLTQGRFHGTPEQDAKW